MSGMAYALWGQFNTHNICKPVDNESAADKISQHRGKTALGHRRGRGMVSFLDAVVAFPTALFTTF